jgi:hypothetical protein
MTRLASRSHTHAKQSRPPSIDPCNPAHSIVCHGPDQPCSTNLGALASACGELLSACSDITGACAGICACACAGICACACPKRLERCPCGFSSRCASATSPGPCAGAGFRGACDGRFL